MTDNEAVGMTYRMDPCGECVEGMCDGCDPCKAFAALPGAKPHEATWFDLEPHGAEARRRRWHAMDLDHSLPFEKCSSLICRGLMAVPR